LTIVEVPSRLVLVVKQDKYYSHFIDFSQKPQHLSATPTSTIFNHVLAIRQSNKILCLEI